MAFRRKLQIADGSKSKGRYRRSARRIRAVAVCLGLVALLLLGVIIAMLGHYIGPCRGNDMEQTSDFSACPNLRLQYLQLQGSYNTSLELKNKMDTELSFLTEEMVAREVELDALKDKRDALENEMEDMQAEQQQLQTRVERLQRECPGDMPTKIYGKCYYFSQWSSRTTWDHSKRDCESRGGQLAIVKTEWLARELNYRMHSQNGWIGLSSHYSTWKWVDRTDMSSHSNMWLSGYPNSYSHRRCAALRSYNGGFCDLQCNEQLTWICEKDL